MKLLSRSRIYDIVRENQGKIFSCVFIKKDGSRREMKCRTGVKKYLAGGELSYDPIEKGLLPVYEIKDCSTPEEKENSYRMVNVNTLIELKIAGEEYRIIDVLIGGKTEENQSEVKKVNQLTSGGEIAKAVY